MDGNPSLNENSIRDLIYFKVHLTVKTGTWIGILFLALSSFSFSKERLAVIGVTGAGLDSTDRENLAREIGVYLGEDTSLVVYDLRKKHGEILDRFLSGSGSPAKEILDSMGASDLRYGVSISLEAGSLLFQTHLKIWDMRLGSLEKADTLRFLSEITARKKKLAQRMAEACQALLGPATAKHVEQGRTMLEYPLYPAMIFRDNELVASDTIREIFPGATIITGDSAGLLRLMLGQSRYVLFGASSYTLSLPEVLQLNRGRLAILESPDTGSILTPSLKVAKAPKTMALVSHTGSVSMIKVLKGKAGITAVLSSRAPLMLKPMQAAHSRGYSITVQPLDAAEAATIIKAMEEHRPSKASRLFLPQAFQLRDKLFSYDPLRPRPNPTAQEFLSQELSGIGAQVGILYPEGGYWRMNDNGIRTGGHDAGCYLCSPDRLGP